MKNILKLIAVVALCFVIGTVLVACGDKGNSAPEIGANGNWYVNGEDTGIPATGPAGQDGKDLSANCEHEWAHYEAYGHAHTQTEDGLVIKACTKCGYAVVAYETIHVWGEPETYEATCEEGAYEGVKCTVCGAAGEGKYTSDPLGHEWTEKQPVAADGEYICVDGGVWAWHCATCHEVKHETTEAVGHKFATTTVVTEASKAGEGKLKGVCVYCEHEHEYILPALDETKYEFTSVAPTCSETGKETYVFVDADHGVNYTRVLTIAANGHFLGGKNYAKYDIDGDNTNGIVVPFFYGEEDADGRLPALGVKEFADSTIPCGTTALGYFQCETCKEVVDVDVYKEHNGKATNIRPSSCIATGLKDVECDACKETVKDVVIPALDHAWVTKLERNVDGITWNLVQECKGNGLATDTCDARQVLESGITDVAEKVIKAPTCEEEGVVEYSYTKDGVTTKVEVNVAKIAHTLNGKLDTELVNADGTFDHTIDGLKYFADTEAPKCDAADPTIAGYYVCEACTEAVYVTIKVVHIPVNPTITVDPSCETKGEKTYTCETCTKPITEDVDPVGHNKTYKLEKGIWTLDLTDDGVDNPVTYKFALHTNCDRKNCDDNGVDVEPVQYFVEAEEVAKVDPTCYSEGSITYAVEVGGVKTQVEVVVGKNPHTLNGKFETEYHHVVGGVTTIKSSVEGIKSFADDEFECEDVVHGYYVCSVCEAAKQEETVVYVNVYQEHDLVLSGDQYKAPTCTENGEALCAHCNTLQPIEALGHDLEISVKEVNVQGLQVILTATCVRENCEFTSDSRPMYLPVLEDELYDVVPTLNAVCGVPGSDKYTIGFDMDTMMYVAADDDASDVTIEFEVETPADVHNAQHADSLVLIINVTDENKWYEVYVCDKCGAYIVIDFGVIDPELV